MTVVAAKIDGDTIRMACDSQFSRGWHHKATGNPEKLVKGADFVVGISGSAMVLPLLTVYAKDHSIGTGGEARITEWLFEFLGFCKSHTQNWDQDATLLLAHASGLFVVEDWLPLRVHDFAAIGSGFQHAEAALHLGHSAREAVEVAIAMAYGCGGEIVEVSQEMRESKGL